MLHIQLLTKLFQFMHLNEGYMTDVEVKKIVDFDAALISYFRSEHAALMQNIDETGDYNKDIEAEFKAGIESFKATQTYDILYS